jgi:phosphate-selective porin OprO and OprP
LCGRPALADDAAIQKLEAQIQQIEARHQAEISSLQAEIRQLRRQRPAGVLVTKGPLEVPVAEGPHVIETTKNGVHFGFADANEQNTVEVTGRLHIDTGGYLNYQPGPKTLDQTGLASGIDFRRARIGVVGKFLGDWNYSLIYDFGNTSDGYNPNNALANANSSSAPGTSNNFLSGVENAYITYNGFCNHGSPFPTAIDLPGVQDVPWTLDEATGSNNLTFMERSSSQVIATAFGGGDFRTAAGVHSNNDHYWVGAYITGPNSGALHTDGATCISGTAPCTLTPSGLGPQLSGLFRACYQIVQTKGASLHIGFNYANVFDPRLGANVDGISLSDRPELRVDPTTFLNAANIPAHGGEVFGGEAAAAWQNFFVQGEYYHYIVDTLVNTTPGNPASSSSWTGGQPGPALNFNGGYVEASHSFGGKRHYVPANGAYAGVIPDVPFTFGGGGWGALEIAGRYSVVDLNDPNLTTGVLKNYSVPGTISGSGATYGGSEQTSCGAGINWYRNGNLKFMLDYEHVVVDNPQYYGGPNWRGATIDWLAGRTQIIFRRRSRRVSRRTRAGEDYEARSGANFFCPGTACAVPGHFFCLGYLRPSQKWEWY